MHKSLVDVRKGFLIIVYPSGDVEPYCSKIALFSDKQWGAA